MKLMVPVIPNTESSNLFLHLSIQLKNPVAGSFLVVLAGEDFQPLLLPHPSTAANNTNGHWMKGGWWHERRVNKFLNKYGDNTALNLQYIYVQYKMSIAGYWQRSH